MKSSAQRKPPVRVTPDQPRPVIVWRNDSVPQDHDVLALLRADVERRKAELDQAKLACEAYEKLLKMGTSTPVASSQFRGKRLVHSVIEYLDIKGAPVGYGELIDALLRGGADLGKTPDRHIANVKVAVKMNARLVESDGETVWKKGWKKTS